MIFFSQRPCEPVSDEVYIENCVESQTLPHHLVKLDIVVL